MRYQRRSQPLNELDYKQLLIDQAARHVALSFLDKKRSKHHLEEASMLRLRANLIGKCKCKLHNSYRSVNEKRDNLCYSCELPIQ